MRIEGQSFVVQKPQYSVVRVSDSVRKTDKSLFCRQRCFSTFASIPRCETDRDMAANNMADLGAPILGMVGPPSKRLRVDSTASETSGQ